MTAGNAHRDLRWWLTATAGLVFAAIAVRLLLNFAHAYPPATDAGYYPMQTRTWFEHGRLMYDDLPLVFWLNAAITRALLAAGVPFENALLTASRLIDCVLPPFAAVAVMAMGYAWSGGRRRALAGCIASSALLLFSPPVMRMLSEFQKNSLGIVWMALALAACRAAMQQSSLLRWLVLGAIMGLAALTHVGAFSVTAVMIGIALVIWTAAHLREPGWRPRAGFSLTLAVVGGATIIALLVYFEPSRAMAVLRSPLRLFDPAWRSALMEPSLILGLIVMCLGIRRLWKDRCELSAADVAIMAAVVATLLVLVAPKSMQYHDRLLLMSPVPGAFILAFIMSRRAVAGVSPWPAWALLAVMTAVAAAGGMSLQVPYMSTAAAAELRDLRPYIADPWSTLIVAPHGLQWWAGYFLGTPVRTYHVPDAAFARYRRVLLLRSPSYGVPESEDDGFPRRLLDMEVDQSARLIYKGDVLELYELPRPQ